jgi:hypothetical protein
MNTLNKFLVIAAVLTVGISLGSVEVTAKTAEDHKAWGQYQLAANSSTAMETKYSKAWLLYMTSTRLW